jgi:hypothetical protein
VITAIFSPPESPSVVGDISTTGEKLSIVISVITSISIPQKEYYNKASTSSERADSTTYLASNEALSEAEALCFGGDGKAAAIPAG